MKPATRTYALACGLLLAALLWTYRNHFDNAFHFDDALELAREAGYTHSVRFRRRRRKKAPLPSTS